MPLNELSQASSATQAALQAYTAQSTGSTESNGLFFELLQSELTSKIVSGNTQNEEAALEAKTETKTADALSSSLPMLMLSSMLGTGSSSSSSTSPVMMALMLALSSKRGQEELAGLGDALLAGGVAGYNNIDSVRAYASSVKSGEASTKSGAAGSAVSGSSSMAGRAVSAADAARFNQATAIISNAGNRSADTYRKVIDQFDVENNPRYAPRDGSTYCNIFQWDVTKAMGAEIPHYTNAVTGEPTTTDDPDVRHMNANRISNWLNTYGEKYGWYEVSAEQAQRLANQGHPAVTIWKNNSGGHGHCQVVCPLADGNYDPQKGVAIAQAGRRLMNYSYITNVYSSTLPEVQYFAHK